MKYQQLSAHFPAPPVPGFWHHHAPARNLHRALGPPSLLGSLGRTHGGTDCAYFCTSGLVMSLGYAIDDMMVTVWWANRNVEGFIRTIKFIELSASNMLAITNLAISVNLALIVTVSNRPYFGRNLRRPWCVYTQLSTSASVRQGRGGYVRYPPVGEKRSLGGTMLTVGSFLFPAEHQPTC